MALVVEDGTIVAGAESYIEVADADSYFTDHGSPTDWTGASTATKEAALRYATAWIDAEFTWLGQVVDTDQVLDWPRAGVYDDENRYVASTSIPRGVQHATCEAALEHIRSALNKAQERGGLEKRVKAGSVEVEYMDRASGGRQRPYITDLLGPFLAASGHGLRLVRA